MEMIYSHTTTIVAIQLSEISTWEKTKDVIGVNIPLSCKLIRERRNALVFFRLYGLVNEVLRSKETNHLVQVTSVIPSALRGKKSLYGLSQLNQRHSQLYRIQHTKTY